MSGRYFCGSGSSCCCRYRYLLYAIVERRMVPFYEPLHTFAIWIEHPATNELEIFSYSRLQTSMLVRRMFYVIFLQSNEHSELLQDLKCFVSFRFHRSRSHSRSISQTIQSHTLAISLLSKEYICLVPYRFRYSTGPFEMKHYFILLLAGIRGKNRLSNKPTGCCLGWCECV